MMDLKRKAIQVGIAATLCMLISNLLKLKFPFFVLLPAVMPISTYFGETIKFGLNRFIGSCIGAIIGVLLATIQTENIFLIGLGVMILIYLCNYLKWGSTTSIACLVFVSIMVSAKESAFLYSVHRLLDTFIGIAITTFVHSSIFNPDTKQLLKNQAKKIQENLLDIANTKNFSERKTELDYIQSEISSLQEKLKIYGESTIFNPRAAHIKSKLDYMFYILCIIFDQIKIINYINSNEYKKESINSGNFTKSNIDMIISLHKNIFYDEIKNLDNVMREIS
jgi:Predicted membrane protein